MRISIVVPSFNQATFIGRTLDSVLSQQGDDFELSLRVVDGASTDGTVDILRQYRDPRLRWTSERDDGQVDAINKGLRDAQGDIVAWLNSDDLLCDGALARVAAAFRSQPGLTWLHGRCEIVDVHDRPVRRWISRYKHHRAQRHSLERLLTENYVSQMTTFWRRSVHADVGYLDPTLKLAFDYDFWLRLASLGAPFYIPERLACFRWYPSSKSGSQFEDQFREDELVAARYARSRFVLLRKRLTRIAIVSIYRIMALEGRSSGAGNSQE